MNKNRMIAWLENRREDEEISISSINTEHPDYVDSEEERCYLYHQYTIMMLSSIIRYIEDTNKPTEE